jgi:hypothetical protein
MGKVPQHCVRRLAAELQTLSRSNSNSFIVSGAPPQRVRRDRPVARKGH